MVYFSKHMKNLIIRIYRALVPMEVRKYSEVEAVDIARRYGRGNVCIQLGRIMTAEKYKAKVARVLAYDF